jgi:hypothetical protein
MALFAGIVNIHLAFAFYVLFYSCTQNSEGNWLIVVGLDLVFLQIKDFLLLLLQQVRLWFHFWLVLLLSSNMGMRYRALLNSSEGLFLLVVYRKLSRKHYWGRLMSLFLSFNLPRIGF